MQAAGKKRCDRILLKFRLCRNHWKIVLTPFWAAATFASAPVEAFIKSTMALWRLTRNSLLRRERCTKRGQGDVPLGLPPPLGERWGHPHSLSKRMSVKGFLQNQNSPICQVSKKTSRYGVSSPNPYASFGTRISNRAPLPGSPDSIIESPVMLRISAAR